MFKEKQAKNDPSTQTIASLQAKKTKTTKDDSVLIDRKPTDLTIYVKDDPPKENEIVRKEGQVSPRMQDTADPEMLLA